MKLEFDLTKNDYWQYNKYSVYGVKNIRKIFLGTPLTIWGVLLGACLIFKLDPKVCILAAIGMTACYLGTIYVPMRKGVMSISDDKLKNHVVEINTEKGQLVHKFGSKQTKYNKDNAPKVVRKKDYIFVIMETYGAVIIPKSENYSLDEVEKELAKIF